MPDRLFKVAIIGTGMIANAGHIPAWKNLKDDVEIVAVSDVVEERAQLVAKTEGIPYYFSDWKEMLSKVKPDIVSVCTPNAYHKEVTIGSLKAGAHVLCEKPIATNYADAVEMFEVADATGKLLMVGQSARFTNKSIAAKEIVDTGKIGKVYYAETYYMRRRGIPTWGQFHMKKHSGGGPVYDLGVHMIDLLFWLMGNPKVLSVSSMTWTIFGNKDEGLLTSLADSGAPLGVLTPRKYDFHEFDVEDMAVALIRLKNNAIVILKTSWAANIPQNTGQTTLLGTEGGLVLEPLTLVTNMGRYQVNISVLVPEDRKVEFAGHWSETEHFIKVIRGEQEMIVKREEVLNVMKTLDAIYKSAEEGREIWLD